MARVTEKEITKTIREALRSVGIWHYKHWGGMMGLNGVSDIIGCHEGRFFAIEVKVPGRKPTPDQEAFLKDVEQAGGIAIVAYGFDDVVKGLGIEDRFLCT